MPQDPICFSGTIASTIRDVRRSIVLHRGQVVEDSTHEQLLARRGYYQRRYHLQFSGQACIPRDR